jgi:hypothetical protein
MRKWRIEDSEELYNITGWGTSYFGINDKGHVVVTPRKDGVGVDLKDLVDELQLRDVTAPMLVRFPDILDNRIEKISCCFRQAAEEYGYKAENFIIYPIKVNQMRPVVEEIISHGKKFNLGLEAGSKPELHAVIAINMDSDSLIICNGYKDESYIELALLAQKMGKRIFLVVEKMNELKLIAKMAKQLNVKPNIGEAIDLASKSFTQQENVGRAIIVITDGENHEPGAQEAATAANKKGINVFILGIGNTKGAPIPMGDGSYLKDNAGNTVMTALNEQMCKELAQAGKGQYIHVDNTSDAERALNDDIAKLQKGDVTSVVYSAYDEQFQAVGILVILLLIIEICLLEVKNPLLRNIKFFKKDIRKPF